MPIEKYRIKYMGFRYIEYTGECIMLPKFTEDDINDLLTQMFLQGKAAAAEDIVRYLNTRSGEEYAKARDDQAQLLRLMAGTVTELFAGRYRKVALEHQKECGIEDKDIQFPPGEN